MFTNILTMGQVVPWIRSEPCMHMGTCAKGRIGAPALEAIFYRIVGMLGKIKQAMHNISLMPSTFHIALVGGSCGPWLRE